MTKYGSELPTILYTFIFNNDINFAILNYNTGYILEFLKYIYL